MDARPVFVLVTATTCGACVNFKKSVWKSGDRSGYREVLSKNSSIRLIEIEVPNMATKPDANLYPASLAKWVRWYPTMFLFSGNSWNDALPKSRKGSGELEGVILNGEMVNGVPTSKQEGPREPGYINSWIAKNLSSNPIFTGKGFPASSGNSTPPVIPSVPQNKVNAVITSNGKPLVPEGMIPTIGQIRFQDREIDSSYYDR